MHSIRHKSCTLQTKSKAVVPYFHTYIHGLRKAVGRETLKSDWIKTRYVFASGPESSVCMAVFSAKFFYLTQMIWTQMKAEISCTELNWPSLKSALRPPPSARAESANFRPFYVKRADFSPPPPATKKRQKLVKIRPCCPHLATKKGGK